MRLGPRNLVLWSTAAWGAGAVGLGAWDQQLLAVGAGAAAISYSGLRLRGWGPPRKSAAGLPVAGRSAQFARGTGDPTDEAELVEQLLAERRSALLLRPELVGQLTAEQAERAQADLEADMALVPAGVVVMGLAPRGDDICQFDEEPSEGIAVEVPGYYLDRYPVTNRQYQAFVDAGGYEQLALWEPEVLAAVIDFVDRSGHPGPRLWNRGQFPAGLDDHPVVGVSWYEATAYARWVGKRLPSDPEWEKAGSWPVGSPAGGYAQRRYPWGDTMERHRCQVWGSGAAGTAPVHSHPEGVSVGGVFDLVGNVWEWTTGNFGAWHGSRRSMLLPVAMRGIRGGAYDTYFDAQSTCQFQSGEDPLARKHNVGFRCALSLCDVATADDAQRQAADDEQASADRSEPETEAVDWNDDVWQMDEIPRCAETGFALPRACPGDLARDHR